MTNTKTKTAIILSVTLIVGMLIGFFINTMLVKNRFEKFTRMRKPGGVEAMMLEQLNPSEEQRPVIKDILRKFKIRMDNLRIKSFQDFGNLRDSLSAELKPVLTDEQYKRMIDGFLNFDRRVKTLGDKRWRRDGMHDDGPPPEVMPPPERPRPHNAEGMQEGSAPPPNG